MKLKLHSICTEITQEGPRLAYNLMITGVSRETVMQSREVPQSKK